MKVAMVTPWDDVCGNAEYASRLIEEIKKKNDGVYTVKLKFAKDHDKQYLENIIYNIKTLEPDIVHIQHEYIFFGKDIKISNKALLSFVKRIDKPIVITLHTVREDYLRMMSFQSTILFFIDIFFKFVNKFVTKKIANYLLDKLYKKYYFQDTFYKSLAQASKIIVHSPVSKDILNKVFPLLNNKTVVIPIAATRQIKFNESTLRKNKNDIWLVMLGFVSRYKRHTFVIDALKYLPENFKLIIVGGRHPHDPDGLAYWRDLLLSIDSSWVQNRVEITGFIKDKDEYFGILSLGDFFIFPYDEVGQSASAALADVINFKKPIITSTAVSMMEYRYDINSWGSAYAVHCEDPIELSKAIKRIVRQQSDLDNSIFNKHINEVLLSHTPEKVANEHLNAYMEVYKYNDSCNWS